MKFPSETWGLFGYEYNCYYNRSKQYDKPGKYNHNKKTSSYRRHKANVVARSRSKRKTNRKREQTLRRKRL